MNLKELIQKFPSIIYSGEYPKPYPHKIEDISKIKAIVLGCDPSNFSNKDGSSKDVETVFGISGKGADKRYFASIEKNLNQLRFSYKNGNIYVQNLCKNYFTSETEKNENWNTVAEIWIPEFVQELIDLKIPIHIPVFVTARKLYDVLLNEEVTHYESIELYRRKELTPIKPEKNKLNRSIFPLFRGGGEMYSLQHHPCYVRNIKDYYYNHKMEL